jgi:hypothetical protein
VVDAVVTGGGAVAGPFSVGRRRFFDGMTVKGLRSENLVNEK